MTINRARAPEPDPAGDAARWPRVICGLGIAWLAAPVIVFIYSAARTLGDPGILPVLAAAAGGAAVGALIGWGRLGLAGGVSAAIGAALESAIPYVFVAVAYGYLPDVALYGNYYDAVLPSVIGAAVGAMAAARWLRPVALPTGGIAALGLTSVLLWMAFWAVWVLALAPRTVGGL